MARPLPWMAVALATAASLSAQKPGYTDTPQIPGQKWRVHDAERPRPRVVTPGHDNSPPSDAIVLFDGTDLSAWTGRRGEAGWRVADGYMEVNRTGDIRTKQEFGDCQLHVEWGTPVEVKGKSQGRGNSGVFLMGRYEVQVLDSFDNETYADGQASALYGQFPPDVNSSRGPGEWQTYDIVFTAPRFEGGELVSPARVTVFHNGVLTHHARELIGGTTHKKVGKYRAHPPRGPIKLQDHGNPIRYRNIWIRDLSGTAKTVARKAEAAPVAVTEASVLGVYAIDTAALKKYLKEKVAKLPEDERAMAAMFEQMVGGIKGEITIKSGGKWSGEFTVQGQAQTVQGTWKLDGRDLAMTSDEDGRAGTKIAKHDGRSFTVTDDDGPVKMQMRFVKKQ